MKRTTLDKTWTEVRGTIGAAVRDKRPSEEIDELRRDLRALKLAEHIERVVAAAPPLTPAQRDRLAALLSPARSASSGGSAA